MKRKKPSKWKILNTKNQRQSYLVSLTTRLLFKLPMFTILFSFPCTVFVFKLMSFFLIHFWIWRLKALFYVQLGLHCPCPFGVSGTLVVHSMPPSPVMHSVTAISGHLFCLGWVKDMICISRIKQITQGGNSTLPFADINSCTYIHLFMYW